jgi:hypothetical protein
MKKLMAILGSVVVSGGLLFGLIYWIGSGMGGGGHYLIVPDIIKTGEPTDIDLIVTATGGGGPIKGRYRDIAFYYRLTDEPVYKMLQPQPTVLPDNFKAVQSTSFQSEAYKFTIPAYLKGTSGEIEFYIEMTFDGYQNRTNGNKTIKVSDNAKSSYDLRNNLSVLRVCNKNFKINIITLEGIKVTERIAALIDEEFQNSNPNHDTTVCSSLNRLPEYSTLLSGIKDYDYKKLRYLVLLQVPFVIDLKENLIYEVNATNNGLGKVLGRLE